MVLDNLTIFTGDNDVVAVTCGDLVVAADIWIGCLNEVDVVVVAVRNDEVHDAMVAEDNVVAFAGVDLVAVHATEEDVVAIRTVQRIVSADQRIDGEDLVDVANLAIGSVAGAAIAENCYERHDLKTRILIIEVIHAAAVAEDDVVSRTTRDVVIALAAEDDQRQR